MKNSTAPQGVEFAIGFVTFNPAPDFYVRLSDLAGRGQRVYVFDNSPKITKTKACCDQLPHIRYVTAGNNVGLGIGLSVITATAHSDGFSALLFFDQDTGFNESTLDFIRQAANLCSPSKHAKTAALVFDSKSKQDDIPDFTSAAVLLAISSGSLFNLQILSEIGWHNPSYFVDGVDYELCLRARSFGYEISKYGHTPGFDHESEQPDQIVTMFGKRLLLRRYSFARIRDSVGAYMRLIAFTTRQFDLPAASAVSRSLAIYVAGQILARTILRKNA